MSACSAGEAVGMERAKEAIVGTSGTAAGDAEGVEEEEEAVVVEEEGEEEEEEDVDLTPETGR